MKKIILLFLIAFCFNSYNFAQDITFVPRETTLTDSLGTEMIFEIDLTNISSAEQTVFLVRTNNNLPAGWTSSICFDSCLPYWIDSATTTSDYGSSPLQPGETRLVALHVFPITNIGTGYVQIQAGTMRNPNTRITVDLTAIVNPVSVDGENEIAKDYYLDQNYPNPFNPTATINYGIKNSGNVEISVYNILGKKVATLVNGYKQAGSHTVTLDASMLSSGIYFYKITSGSFSQTKKMILEK